MLLKELFEIMEEEVSHNLTGTLSYEGIGIKWYYDSFNVELELDETEEEHLERVFNDDMEIIDEMVELEDFNISEPTIEDTHILFYIEE